MKTEFPPHLLVPPPKGIGQAEELRRRVDLLTELLLSGPNPPESNPYLNMMGTAGSTRRLARRLRQGVVVPEDPSIDPMLLALQLDQLADYRQFLASVMNELTALDSLFWRVFRGVCGDLLVRVDIPVRVVKPAPKGSRVEDDPKKDRGTLIRQLNEARVHDPGKKPFLTRKLQRKIAQREREE